MRYIPIHTFTPSDSWKKRSEKATAELLSKSTMDEILAYIKKNSDIWRDLGRELSNFFGNKCWYTDAANYGARLDVEHFRPKAKTVELKVEDCKEAVNTLLLQSAQTVREGYWWLAFDFENLLLCSQVMNREGKRNFFPLHRDSVVASGTNKDAWRLEIAVFLDPRKLDDVCLVEYDETGAMRPRADVTDWDRLRVVITNECFGLSRFQPLIEGRQQAWQKCSDLIQQYMNAASKQMKEATPNPLLQKEKEHALRGLRSLLDPNEPFSSVAASCMRNSPFEWVKSLASQPPLQLFRNTNTSNKTAIPCHL